MTSADHPAGVPAADPAAGAPAADPNSHVQPVIMPALTVQPFAFQVPQLAPDDCYQLVQSLYTGLYGPAQLQVGVVPAGETTVGGAAPAYLQINHTPESLTYSLPGMAESQLQGLFKMIESHAIPNSVSTANNVMKFASYPTLVHALVTAANANGIVSPDLIRKHQAAQAQLSGTVPAFAAPATTPGMAITTGQPFGTPLHAKVSVQYDPKKR